MTSINAELALAFLKQLAAMHLKYPESTEYRRGVVDIANSMALYLEALIDDPDTDREVAA